MNDLRIVVTTNNSKINLGIERITSFFYFKLQHFFRPFGNNLYYYHDIFFTNLILMFSWEKFIVLLRNVTKKIIKKWGKSLKK